MTGAEGRPNGRVTKPASDLLASLEDNSVGCIVTDPPWKLDGGGRFSVFADYDLLEVDEVAEVLDDARRVLVDGGAA